MSRPRAQWMMCIPILLALLGLYFGFALMTPRVRQSPVLPIPQFSIAMLAGWPTPEEVKKIKLQTFEEELTRYMRSLVFCQDCPTEVFVMTNPTGKVEIQRIWDSLSTHGQVSIRMVDVNISAVHEWTQKELVPRGVSFAFSSRIWHWPKWWVKRILSAAISPLPRFVMILDVDAVVLKSLCVPAREVFAAMVEDQRCFAAVDQRKFSNTVPTVNAGMLYMDMECFPSHWYSAMVSASIRSTWMKYSDRQQWPPEQWLWSSMFDTYPELIRKLPSKFHRHCTENPYPKNKNRLDNETLYLHWCGDRLPNQTHNHGPTFTAADVAFTEQYLARLDAAVTVRKP